MKKAAIKKCRDIANGLKEGQYELVDMRALRPDGKLSKIWDVYRVVRHKETGDLLMAVQCGRCKRVLTYKERDSGTRSLPRHLLTRACKRAAQQGAGAGAGASGDHIWAEKVAPPCAAKREVTKVNYFMKNSNVLSETPCFKTKIIFFILKFFEN